MPDNHRASPGIPTLMITRYHNLTIRAKILRHIRHFFDEHGFIEVETPLLAHSPGMEPFLESFSTEYFDESAGKLRRLYLPTSPEFHMKRLLSEGFDRIYQVTRAFRNNESGPMHHPEFTMLEWYRGGAGYDQIMADSEEMISAVATQVSGTPMIHGNSREISLLPPWDRITVREAWHRYAGIDLDQCGTVENLRRAGKEAGVENLQESDDWETLYFKIFLTCIESKLGVEKPVILYEYPASMAALARIKPQDPSVALRFEIYIDGIELGNAFDELTDPLVQAQRIEEAREQQICMNREPFPRDEFFMAALEKGIPPSAGIALGVDRLVMLILGTRDIQDVLSYSFLKDLESD